MIITCQQQQHQHKNQHQHRNNTLTFAQNNLSRIHKVTTLIIEFFLLLSYFNFFSVTYNIYTTIFPKD